MAQFKVSTIIVTCDSSPVIKECLNSLIENYKSVNGEIIVVDNNSTDGTVRDIRNTYPDVKIIENKKNYGFARGCNIGARAAEGECLYFLNPDVILDDKAVKTVYNFITGNKSVGAAASRMRFPDGSFQPTCRNFPTTSNIFLSRGSLLSRLFFKSDLYTLNDYPVVTQVPAVAGTALMIKKEIFDALGGFDSRFFMYMEDTDLSYRLSLNCYKNYFVPESGGIHNWGKGSSGGFIKRQYYHHLSVWKYFMKHFANGYTLLLLPLLLAVNFLLVTIYSLLKKTE